MFELSNQQTLAYIVGAIGILVECRSYWLQSGKAFRHWSAMGSLFWAVQYFLLDAVTASLILACTALRTLLSGQLENILYKHWAVAGFLIIYGALTTMSWQGEVSLLPAFAVINATLAMFYLDNRKMRIALLFSSLAWIGNDIYWQAWPALLAESVAMTINLRTIRKLFVANSN